MKYYSEKMLKAIMTSQWLATIEECCLDEVINVRRCRNCEYFIRDNANENFGHCEYRTDFLVLDNEPINWYFTNINGFCNEDDIKDDI